MIMALTLLATAYITHLADVEAAGDYFAFPDGFRRVEIKDSVLKINNRRILVKGVNRHEMSATGGYTVTLDEMKRDVAALKSINANAVRTCHYPNDPDWYTLCDQNGIYVWAEANIESHGMGFGGESLAHRAARLRNFHDSPPNGGMHILPAFLENATITASAKRKVDE